MDTLTLDPLQDEAVQKCCDMSYSARVRAITGGAGTGKTTILREVHRRLTQAGYSVALAAPTGKAAKRIREATGLPAQTIHQLLEYTHPGERNPATGKPYGFSYPRRDRKMPLDCDVVLVDEYAMVGVELHSNLIFALKPGGSIRMFGDANQLRPIETSVRAGTKSPFEQALEKFDGVRLEHVYRQAEGSGVLAAGQAIVRGRFPMRAPDFYMRLLNAVVPELHQVVLGALEHDISYGDTWNQIIAPTRRSTVGTTRLNGALRHLFNPDASRKPSITLARHPWEASDKVTISVDDKVICGANMYDMRGIQPEGMTTPPDPSQWIMNGESGIVTDVNVEAGTFDVDLGDRKVHIPASFTVLNKRGQVVSVIPQREFSLAYAITTHKAQGSEYDNVVYIMHRSAAWNQCRGNLYTGVTRAKKSAVVVSDSQSVDNSLRRLISQMDEAGTAPR